MSGGLSTAAVLPVKRFGAAKQRLTATLPEHDRQRLAQAMVRDVLAALGAARDGGLLDQIVVVSSEPTLAGLAPQAGATLVADPEQRGQSAAVRLGIAAAVSAGAGRVLLVPGDCPALDPAELAQLLSAGDEQVVIVPDRHGSGTNALVLAPPDAIEPSFGPDSRARHERLASEAAMAWRVEQPASLLLDIDTAGDLETLRVRLERDAQRRPDLARMTRAVLSELTVTAR